MDLQSRGKLSVSCTSCPVGQSSMQAVLLFDGTGNKFSGEDSDSNILKILRMLDRNDSTQLHYYQVCGAMTACLPSG